MGSGALFCSGTFITSLTIRQRTETHKPTHACMHRYMHVCSRYVSIQCIHMRAHIHVSCYLYVRTSIETVYMFELCMHVREIYLDSFVLSRNLQTAFRHSS